MKFKLLMLMGAPIVIVALSIRPLYALEVNPDNNAIYQKGLELYLKCDTQKDAAGAAALFKEAAEKGHLEAAFSLGVLYQNGEGVTKDTLEAVKWYTKAANQNHAKAQFNLGFLLFEGLGITRDQTTGVKWLQQAAEQGFAKAEYKVGCAYLTGDGVAKNHALAIEWLSKAAAQGDKDAIHTLELAQQMQTPE